MAPVQVLQSKTLPIHTNYELGRKLGKGSFGVVYECRNRHTGFVYACKTIDKSRLEDEADIEDVRREIGVLRLLAGHASIVELQDVYEDDDRVYIVMELCEGGDLFDDIKTNGPLPECHAKGVFRELVSAVAYCHLNSIMHRDIKPENVLFLRPPANSTPDESYLTLSGNPPSGATAGAAAAPFSASSSSSSSSSTISIAATRPSGVKLADFGLALVMAQGDTAVGLTGSRYYTAPEMVRGKRYGRRADVWSLGVVLCTLLTGRLPFAGKTHEDDEGLKRSILKGTVNFEASVWRPISAVAKDLVRQMLTTDPRRRPKAKHLLDHPWLKDTGNSHSATDTAEPGLAGLQQALNAETVKLQQMQIDTNAQKMAAAGKYSAAGQPTHLRAPSAQAMVQKDHRKDSTKEGQQRQPSQHGKEQREAKDGVQREQSANKYLRGVQMWWPQKPSQDGAFTGAASVHAAPQGHTSSQRPILPLMVAPPVVNMDHSKPMWTNSSHGGSPTTPYDALECPSPEPGVSPGGASPCGDPLPMPSPRFGNASGSNGSSKNGSRVCKRALFPSGSGLPQDMVDGAQENLMPAVSHVPQRASQKAANHPPSFPAFDSISARGFSSNRRMPDGYRRSLFSFSPIRRDILQRAFGEGAKAKSKWETTEAQLQRLQQRKQQQQQLMQQQQQEQQQQQQQMLHEQQLKAQQYQQHLAMSQQGYHTSAQGYHHGQQSYHHPASPLHPSAQAKHFHALHQQPSSRTGSQSSRGTGDGYTSKRLSTPERRLPSPIPVKRTATPEKRPGTPTRLGTPEFRAPTLHRRVPTWEKRPATPDMRRSPTPDRNFFRVNGSGVNGQGMRYKDGMPMLSGTPVPSMDGGSKVFRGGPLRGLLSPRTGRESGGMGKMAPSPSAFFGSHIIQCTGVGRKE